MNNYIFYGDVFNIITNQNEYVWITGFGEFLGTFIFLFLMISTIMNLTLPNSKAKVKFPYCWIVLGVFLSLLIGLISSYGIQYGIFESIYGIDIKNINDIASLCLNPAFVISNMIRGINYHNVSFYIPIANGFIYIFLEILGGFLAAIVSNFIFKINIDVKKDSYITRKCFYTIPTSNKSCVNFLTELMGTFILFISVSALSMLVNQNQMAIKIILICSTVAGIGYGIGGLTGYALNPARDLGPRISYYLLYANKNPQSIKDWKYSWIPIFAPCIGAILGMIIMPNFLY